MNWKIAFEIMAIVSVISIVYAFVQTTKAQVVEREALQQKELIDRVVEESRKAKVEVEKNAALWAETRKELEELRKRCK